MTAEQFYYAFQSKSGADVAMSLLRSPNALVHLALMAAHLGDGQSVDGLTLAARVDEDLASLRRVSKYAEDIDANKLLSTWTQKRWVHRGVEPKSRIERYHLTSGAGEAVKQMRNLRRHNSVATESALSMVMGEMRRIATHANPDPAVHIKALEEQIESLTEQRDRLRAGESPEVDNAELVDRVSALVQLIERIPTDLAHYGERMHDNTAELLRKSLADEAVEFAESLQRMFDGHDVIAESPEGQAFRAFATLVAIPSQRTQFEADIAEVVTRVEGLPAYVVSTLRGFIDAMWQRVKEVEEVRGMAFRRMSNFVRGGDAHHYRSMRTRISEAQAAASSAFQRTHGGRDIGFEIPAPGVDSRSVGRLRLSEGPPVPPDPVVDATDEFRIDPAALAGREAINWAALRDAVHAAMEAHGGYATLEEVLEQLAAPRVGDIVGIWSLAVKHGDVDENAPTTVWAHTRRGLREMSLPYLVFGEAIPASAAAPARRRALGRQPELMLMEGTAGE